MKLFLSRVVMLVKLFAYRVRVSLVGTTARQSA